jgi:hypothetical protein
LKAQHNGRIHRIGDTELAKQKSTTAAKTFPAVVPDCGKSRNVSQHLRRATMAGKRSRQFIDSVTSQTADFDCSFTD